MQQKKAKNRHIAADKRTSASAKTNKPSKRMPSAEVPCGVCSTVFPSMTKLKWHMCKQHPRSFACHLCDRRYCLPRNLEEHIARFHERQTPRFQCSICGVRITTNYSLQEHMRAHSGEEPFKCEFCYRTFAVKKELRRHRKSHIGLQPPKPPRKIVDRALIKPHPNPKQHACHLCGARYNRAPRLKLHIEIRHELKRGKYGCSICGKWLINPQVLLDHLDAHRGVRSYTCDFCGKTFSWLNSLKEHLARRHRFGLLEYKATYKQSKGSFACSRCDKNFSLKKSLALHLHWLHVVAVKKATRTCCRCNTTFAGLDGLRRHMKHVHLQVRKFTCNVCERPFKASDHLARHIADVHERKKAFCCALCSFASSDKEKLSVHVVSRHYGFDRSQPQLFRHVCEVCNIGFVQGYGLKFHARLHCSTGVWKCSICRLAFGGPDWLANHLMATHAHGDEQGKLYACSHCELRFGAAALLIEHLSYYCNFMPHRCCACSAGFRTRQELIGHARRVHKPSMVTILCLWCPKRLSVGEHMKHVIEHFAATRKSTGK